MKAGLVGEKLSHSLSPLIHRRFYSLTGIDGSYRLFEAPKASLGELLSRLEREGFEGLNVTIPYKTEVIQYLSRLSDGARAIGAVNTVLFRDGKRYGFNTDYFGLKTLIESSGIRVFGAKVVILGTGGAARCALKLARDMGALSVAAVTPWPEEADSIFNAVNYNALDLLTGIDILINASPVGMSPDTDGCPVSGEVIQKCKCVVDLIYNPAETRLLAQAKALGKTAAGGLKMLCAQAVKSQEIWNGRSFGDEVYAGVFEHMQGKSIKTNIVLIGMPGSGKTTVGGALAKKLGMKFADTDAMIEEAHGQITDIFKNQGEAAFRKFEHEAAINAAAMMRTVISTGGGIVLDKRNMEALRETGTIVFLDRPLERLLEETDTSGRPLLAAGKSAIEALYKQRHALYAGFADIIPDNSADKKACVADILKKLEE